MTVPKTHDIIVIGAGPGGYVSAIRAAQLGFKTAIVEREHLGGVCLNWGCIPTKALLRSAEVYRLMRHADAFGLSARDVAIDLGAVVKRSRDVAAKLNAGVAHLLRKNKVDLIWGQAQLAGSGTISVITGTDGNVPKGGVAGGTYQADHTIIATGARPLQLPGVQFDGKRIWSYREAMVPTQMPSSLAIIGAGAIGIEFASFYATLGVEVTLIEMREQILPTEDAEISLLARRALEKQGIRIFTSSKVTGVQKLPGHVAVTTQEAGGKVHVVKADRMIVAVGMTGNTEGLGLEARGVRIERGLIATDEFGRTNISGIYAIGDVASLPMLAHKAAHEGVLCVEALAGSHGGHRLDRRMIPACIYCTPQIASVGLTEAAAHDEGYDTRVGRFPFAGNGKALAMGEPEGLVKTIFDRKTGRLLGAHMIGAEVTELIQGYAVAMNLETTEAELMHTVYPHPTLSEMMHESTLDAYGRAIHI